MLVVERYNTNMIKSIISILSFIGMTALSYITVRTEPDVTKVFALLSIVSLFSILLVGKFGTVLKYFMSEDDEHREQFENKFNLLTVSLFVIALLLVSYGIIYFSTIISVVCVSLIIMLFSVVVL